MATRRTFSPTIVESDAFIEMPISTQALYFHLGMFADDDGFVNPKKVVRLLGASDDDLKVLLGKRFVLPFENGVIVIKHWRINNQIRKDWHRPTIYQDELLQLEVKENGVYTELGTETTPNSVPIRHRSIAKSSTVKKRKKATAKPPQPDPQPFNPEETKKKWYEGDKEDFQLLAWFFDQKKLWGKFDSREKVEHAVQRHIRSARRIIRAGWNQKECTVALVTIKKNEKLIPEWTLETLEKYLTK